MQSVSKEEQTPPPPRSVWKEEVCELSSHVQVSHGCAPRTKGKPLVLSLRNLRKWLHRLHTFINHYAGVSLRNGAFASIASLARRARQLTPEAAALEELTAQTTTFKPKSLFCVTLTSCYLQSDTCLRVNGRVWVHFNVPSPKWMGAGSVSSSLLFGNYRRLVSNQNVGGHTEKLDVDRGNGRVCHRTVCALCPEDGPRGRLRWVLAC